MRRKFGSGLIFTVVAGVVVLVGLNAIALWVTDRPFDFVKSTHAIVDWLGAHATANYLILAGLFGTAPLVGLLGIVVRRVTGRKQD